MPKLVVYPKDLSEQQAIAIYFSQEGFDVSAKFMQDSSGFVEGKILEFEVEDPVLPNSLRLEIEP